MDKKKTLFALSFLFSLTSFAETSDAFLEMVTVNAISDHQKKLEDIAKQNGGNRSAGSRGYAQSVDYIYDQMQKAGYNVLKQDFTIRLQKDESTPVFEMPKLKKTYILGKDFMNMTNEASVDITGEIEAVDLEVPSNMANHSTSGCEEADFINFKAGNIALLQRGTCSFSQKALNAQKAGAQGVIIFNEGNPDRTEVFSGKTDAPGIAVISTSFLVGEELRAKIFNGPTKNMVRIKVDVRLEARTVQNVIAESKEGDANRVVAIGAHLDSVKEGPGINDNGSGSATILEIAKQYAKLSAPKNKLRFLWFSAEELGLLGSDFYVKSLSFDERNKIMAMLNFDMLSSHNYVRFVYDGDNSGKTEILAQTGPEGSAYLENIFLNYFSNKNLASEPTAFNGRSDYGPFIKVGIPAGGLFSGAEGLKTNRQAQIYGGTAKKPYDACYHRLCDNMRTNSSSLAKKSLDELSDAAAHAVFLLAQTSDTIRLPRQEEINTIDFEYEGNHLVK